jgi:hypothetical protein
MKVVHVVSEKGLVVSEKGLVVNEKDLVVNEKVPFVNLDESLQIVVVEGEVFVVVLVLVVMMKGSSYH